MSLKDTIRAAREEASPVVAGLPSTKVDKDGNKVKKPKDKDISLTELPTTDERKGFSKRSAANAKPAREAAAGVRVVSAKGTAKSSQTETKAEKKARKRREREQEDLRERALDTLQRADPKYDATTRVWWVLLGSGFAMAVVSLIVTYVVGSDSEYLTIGSTIALVLAYALIIAAFIYDLVRRRPIRKNAERQIQAMSDKKVQEVLEREKQRLIEEDRAEAAARAAEPKEEKKGLGAKLRGLFGGSKKSAEAGTSSAAEPAAAPKDSKY